MQKSNHDNQLLYILQILSLSRVPLVGMWRFVYFLSHAQITMT